MEKGMMIIDFDGILIVLEIPEQFVLFHSYIETAVIHSDREIVFQNNLQAVCIQYRI